MYDPKKIRKHILICQLNQAKRDILKKRLLICTFAIHKFVENKFGKNSSFSHVRCFRIGHCSKRLVLWSRADLVLNIIIVCRLSIVLGEISRCAESNMFLMLFSFFGDDSY